MVKEKFDEAKVCLNQAYDVLSQIHGKNNPEVATILNNLAVVCTNVCKTLCKPIITIKNLIIF